MKNIRIEILKGNRFKILEDYKYKNILVKKGFIFNGASIPRVLWSILGSPSDSKYIYAALFHDALYATHKLTKKEADFIFYELLNISETNSILKNSLYIGTKLLGQKAWNKYSNTDKYNKYIELTD